MSNDNIPTGKTFTFTQRTIDRLAPCAPDSRASCDEYTDDEITGFKVQVTKGGRKFFYLRYTYRSAKRAARIGEFPSTTVADARKKALAMRALLDSDQDPQAERDQMRVMPTFRDFSQNQYLPHAYQTKRSAKGDEGMLRKHLWPRFGHRKLGEIETHEIQVYLNELARKLTKATANRHHSLIARMYKLAVIWKMLERSPCFGLVKFREDKRAERFLSPVEIGRFVAALEQDDNPVIAAALKLLLLTGLRRNEVIKARWDQVDLDARLLYLPKTKAGKPRYAVLNSVACELVKNLPSRGASPWLFPARSGDKPIENPKSTLLRVLERAGIDPMRTHDLRHSFASTAINAGATLAEVQGLLGHSSIAMTERYAHLAQDNVRRASEVVASVVATVAVAPQTPAAG
jgi:integrase